MAKHVLLTGATGLLGSNIAYRLLKRGAAVHALVRGRSGSDPRARLKRVLQVVDPEFQLDHHDCEVIEGDVTLPGCGLAPGAAERLRGIIDAIWHSAASVNFALGGGAMADETRRVNVGGTLNLLALARYLGAPPFHHISTAYVAGFHEGIFMEDDHRRQRRIYRNAYEQSKLDSEHLVHAYPGPWSIYRPSVIVGDSQTGRTLTFTGYYQFCSGMNTMRVQLGRPANARGGASGGAPALTPHGRFLIPIVLPCGSSNSVNLVPIDWVSEMMLRLGEAAPPCKKTFHLTHPSPPNTRWLIELSSKLIGIAGLRFAEPYVLPTLLMDAALVHGDDFLQSVQRDAIDRIAPYVSYLCQGPEFDDSNVRATLKGSYSTPPAVTEPFLRTLLDYALAKGFKEAAA